MRSLSALLAASAILRIVPPTMLAAPRIRAAEIKKRLEAAGISTAGIVEKEELYRLLQDLDDNAATTDCITLQISFLQGGAYAEIDELKFLVDSGSATTIMSATAATARGVGPPGARVTLTSRRVPLLSLSCGVASPQQALPPGVDGILGVDTLRTYAAAELDWSIPELRLHPSYNCTEADDTCTSLPMSFRRVAGGELPFVKARFEGAAECALEALVDTGTPVSMATPEVAAAAQLDLSSLPADADVLTTGVDGQPTRMRATLCRAVALGCAAEGGLSHVDATVYSGTCPMMAKVGWEGQPAALLGLDVLRSSVRAGQPPAAAAGGPRTGRLVLDFERGFVRVYA